MTDWFDNLDEEVDEDALGSEGEGGSAKPAGVFGTEFTLEEVAARGGRFAELAGELLAIRKEREEGAERERLAEQGLHLEMNGSFDEESLDAVREAVAARVEAERRASNESYLAMRREEYEGQGFARADIDRWMKGEQEAIDASAWLTSADPLYESAAYREWETDRVLAARSDRHAADVASGFRSIEQDAADAMEGILVTVSKTLNGAEG